MAELDTKAPEVSASDTPKPDSPFSSLDSSTDTFGGLLSGDSFKKASSDLETEYKKYESSRDKLTVQQRRIAEERDTQLKRMMDAEGATAADMQPFNPEAAAARHSHNLWEQFGSPGFVFGMLASAFTGMPMTNALNAGAAAMKSINEGDLEGYHREFDAWKTNTDLVIKRFNMEKEAFDQIEHLYKDKLDEWHAQALANAARFDDRKAQIMLENGMYPDLLKARDEQYKLIQDMSKVQDQLDMQHTKQLIVNSILTDKDGNPKFDLHKNPQILVEAKKAADMAVDGNPQNPEQAGVMELFLDPDFQAASSKEKQERLLDLQTKFYNAKSKQTQIQQTISQRQIESDVAHPDDTPEQRDARHDEIIQKVMEDYNPVGKARVEETKRSNEEKERLAKLKLQPFVEDVQNATASWTEVRGSPPTPGMKAIIDQAYNTKGQAAPARVAQVEGALNKIRQAKDDGKPMSDSAQEAELRKAVQRPISQSDEPLSKEDIEGLGWPPSAIDIAANAYRKTGHLPSNVGTRTNAGKIIGAIETRAGELERAAGRDPANLSQQWALYQAQRTGMSRYLSGPQANTARSLNVVIAHLDLMTELGKALHNHEVTRFNALAQQLAEETGKPAPTNFDTAKQIVGAEIIKALGVAGGGASGERQEAAENFKRSRDFPVIQGSIDTLRRLLVPQLEGLRRGFTPATGLPVEMFDSELLPRTQEALRIGTAAEAAKTDDGWGDLKVVK